MDLPGGRAGGLTLAMASPARLAPGPWGAPGGWGPCAAASAEPQRVHMLARVCTGSHKRALRWEPCRCPRGWGSRCPSPAPGDAEGSRDGTAGK